MTIYGEFPAMFDFQRAIDVSSWSRIIRNRWPASVPWTWQNGPNLVEKQRTMEIWWRYMIEIWWRYSVICSAIQCMSPRARYGCRCYRFDMLACKVHKTRGGKKHMVELSWRIMGKKYMGELQWDIIIYLRYNGDTKGVLWGNQPFHEDSTRFTFS